VGDGIIDHLLNSRIAPNLYYDRAKDLMGDNMRKSESVESLLKKEAGIKTYYGVYTDSQSREDMFAILAMRINEYPDKFITNNIITDISNLVRTRSSKIAAAPGAHDDSIMSLLTAYEVRYRGNNLPQFGIFLGVDEKDLKNDGMIKGSDEIDPLMVNEKALREAKHLENLKKKTVDYDKMMQEAARISQNETYKMKQAGLIENSIYDNTPDEVIEDIMEGQGSIDMRLFDELNGNNRMAQYVLQQQQFNDPISNLW
jgi:hypothetical protein